MKLFDAHCHLQTEDDAGALYARLKEFHESGGCYLMCCGTKPDDWHSVSLLSAEHSAVMASYGVHPWFVSACSHDDWLQRLQEYLEKDPEAGIGEIGLDHRIRVRDDVRQKAVFVSQLKLARSLNRVVTVHCVQAWGALLEALDEAGPLPRGFVLHAYSGSVEMIPPLLRRGAFFSFKGGRQLTAISRRTAACLRAIPVERLLIESDFSVSVHRRETHEALSVKSDDLISTVSAISICLATSVLCVAEQTFENAVRCFCPGQGQMSKSLTY